eukprot:g81136.t1
MHSTAGAYIVLHPSQSPVKLIFAAEEEPYSARVELRESLQALLDYVCNPAHCFPANPWAAQALPLLQQLLDQQEEKLAGCAEGQLRDLVRRAPGVRLPVLDWVWRKGDWDRLSYLVAALHTATDYYQHLHAQ